MENQNLLNRFSLGLGLAGVLGVTTYYLWSTVRPLPKSLNSAQTEQNLPSSQNNNNNNDNQQATQVYQTLSELALTPPQVGNHQGNVIKPTCEAKVVMKQVNLHEKTFYQFEYLDLEVLKWFIPRLRGLKTLDEKDFVVLEDVTEGFSKAAVLSVNFQNLPEQRVAFRNWSSQSNKWTTFEGVVGFQEFKDKMLNFFSPEGTLLSNYLSKMLMILEKMEEHSSTLCNYRPSFLIIFENDFSKHEKLILNLIDFQPDPENNFLNDLQRLTTCVSDLLKDSFAEPLDLEFTVGDRQEIDQFLKKINPTDPLKDFLHSQTPQCLHKEQFAHRKLSDFCRSKKV